MGESNIMLHVTAIAVSDCFRVTTYEASRRIKKQEILGGAKIFGATTATKMKRCRKPPDRIANCVTGGQESVLLADVSINTWPLILGKFTRQSHLGSIQPRPAADIRGEWANSPI